MLGQWRTQYRRSDTKIIDGRASGSAPWRVSICDPMGWRPAMTGCFTEPSRDATSSAPALRHWRPNALPSAAPAPGARCRRFEISDPGMPPRILDSYKKGIREMLNRPPTDPRNWYRNAFIHVFDCPHQNGGFWPGTAPISIRAFSSDPEFALPYWDW